jgi:hypothetical protein
MQRHDRFFVCIDHLDEDKMMFFGWAKVRTSDDFLVYRRIHDGEEQIVEAKGRKFLLLDDFNDAQQMGNFMIKAPSGGRRSTN